MSLNWVVNSSPLIILGKISKISLLFQMNCNLIIPSGVAKEIDLGADIDPAKIWMNKEGYKYTIPIGENNYELAKWDLGLGETEVISYCFLNPSSVAIVDDLAARRCAATYGIKCKGTLGVILEAKRSGLIEKIKPTLNQLIRSGFRINKSLYEAVLRHANE